MTINLQHGLFIARYHDVTESPTIGLRRDLERRQNGSGWTSGSTQVRLASAVNSRARVQ